MILGKAVTGIQVEIVSNTFPQVKIHPFYNLKSGLHLLSYCHVSSAGLFPLIHLQNHFSGW